MQRRYAEYRPASRWRLLIRRHRPFRSVRLNLFGWAAIMLLCLVGAALGHGGSRLIGLPDALGVVADASGVLTALFVLDRRRWGQMSGGSRPTL
jgi:hypothetical protein